jgi:hypothetical protein
MVKWNQRKKPRAGIVGTGAQLVVAASITATMLVGSGYVAPGQLGGGFAAAEPTQ